MTQSLSAIIFMFTLLILLYSYMLMMFERPTAEGPLKNWANSVWNTIVTMTTVGYGDIYPTTRLGRIVAISASFSALVMIAIITNIVGSTLAMSRSEVKVVNMTERRSMVKDYRDKAARLVSTTLRVCAERSKALRDPPHQTPVEYEELLTGQLDTTPKPVADMPLSRPPSTTRTVKPDDSASQQPMLSARSFHSSKSRPEPIRANVPDHLKKDVVVGYTDNDLENQSWTKYMAALPGGGRGRPKRSVIYGEQLPLPVVLAEEKWHLAMHEFRQIRRDIFHFDMAQSSDVITSVLELECQIGHSERKLEVVEDLLDDSIKTMQELLQQIKEGK
eukprot:CAMPEP_0184309208 /NCGR_PEP_ID=MMETSP1049-20130417/17444_1 /TAXON_ID=77928 /ORGANISM="Proteomonas sulcata, Strain CCMP704" /LENGTH=332 /DNA_ID=CAMNT_0026622057 /DNA_START=171 /DNA_END=1169 /DNA_ORIENTATION=+